MTSIANDFASAAQEQALQATKQSQEAFVTAVRTWTEAVARATPTVPFAAVPGFSYASSLPTVESIVDMSFGYADKLLDAQHAFIKNLVAAAAPITKA